MKNSSKDNHPWKNIKQNRKNSNSYFSSKNSNSSKKNNISFKDSFKNKSNTKFSESNKNKSDFSSQRIKQISKSNADSSKKARDIQKDPLKRKNFDDWIWGKHSVFEALSNQRAINRIWCTSEIFSSDKFYILFKELKSRSLIEEVSWNRISQLTFGASHQGVALQLAYSKTISGEINLFFKKEICESDYSSFRRYYWST